MKKRNVWIVMAVTLVLGLMMTAGCGGGGGGSTITSTPAVTTISDATASSAAQDSVDMAQDLVSLAKVQSTSDNSVARRAGRVASRQAAATTTYTNESETETGCTLNGSLTMTETSPVNVSGTVTRTSCNDSFMNGDYAHSGTITQTSSTTLYSNLVITFSQASTTLVMAIPMKGTYTSTTDTFTPDSGASATVNGTDANGITYSGFTMSEGSNGTVYISGTATDGDGFAMTLSSSWVKDDGSASLNFSASDDVSGQLTLNADGSGSGTFTQTSNSAAVLTLTWTSTGSGTITYADGTTESFTT